MTKEETKKAIEVMQAYVDGKAIEYWYSGQWLDLTNPEWGWDNSLGSYRIKPEPMEIEVYINQHGTFSLPVPLDIDGSIWTKRKFREVV